MSKIVSPFHNFSDVDICDEIGDLDAQVKALEKRIKAAKEELAERDVSRVEGERFNIQRSDFCRWTLIREDVVAELGEDWCTKHSKIAPVTKWTVTVRRDSLSEVA